MTSTCFFFNDTATTEIYTLSLHDALPISSIQDFVVRDKRELTVGISEAIALADETLSNNDLTIEELKEKGFKIIQKDRKSTRLNSSHANISYAVFCLKKKKHPLSVPLLAV